MEPMYMKGSGIYSLPLSSTPSWNVECGILDNGLTWKRYVSWSGRGRPYSFALGIKLTNIIGIDLPVEKPYAASANMVYKIGATGVHEMCGKDDDPYRASKVRERLR